MYTLQVDSLNGGKYTEGYGDREAALRAMRVVASAFDVETDIAAVYDAVGAFIDDRQGASVIQDRAEMAEQSRDRF